MAVQGIAAVPEVVVLPRRGSGSRMKGDQQRKSTAGDFDACLIGAKTVEGESATCEFR